MYTLPGVHNGSLEASHTARHVLGMKAARAVLQAALLQTFFLAENLRNHGAVSFGTGAPWLNEAGLDLPPCSIDAGIRSSYRWQFGSVVLGGDTICIAGGATEEDGYCPLDTAACLNTSLPAASWKELPRMLSTRIGPAIVALNATTLCLLGGNSMHGITLAITSTGECFTIGDTAWRPLPDMSVERTLFQVVPIMGGRIICAVGGVTNQVNHGTTLLNVTNTAECHEIGTHAWSPLPPLQHGRSEHGIFKLEAKSGLAWQPQGAVQQTTICVAGGVTGFIPTSTVTGSVECITIGDPMWTEGLFPSMNYPRRAFDLVQLREANDTMGGGSKTDGLFNVCALGGMGETGAGGVPTLIASVECLTGFESWSAVNPTLPGPIVYSSSAAFSNGKVCMLGGKSADGSGSVYYRNKTICREF